MSSSTWYRKRNEAQKQGIYLQSQQTEEPVEQLENYLSICSDMEQEESQDILMVFCL